MRKSGTSRTWNPKNISISRPAAIVLLILICIASVSTEWRWATGVPILQQMDEIGHLDYALDLRANGPLLRRTGNPVFTATDQERYLVKKVRYRELKYDFSATQPKGYRTEKYIADLDKNAPPYIPTTLKEIPYVEFSYESPYYIILATAMEIRSSIQGQSLYWDCVVARLVGIPFLIGTLIAIYIAISKLTKNRITALLITATISQMPVVTILFASIQPDVLTTFFVTGAIASLILLEEKPSEDAWLRVLGFTAACYLVKPVYATILATAILPCAMAILHVRLRDTLVRGTATIVILAVAGLTFTTNLPAHYAKAQPSFYAHFPGLIEAITTNLTAVYGGGVAFASFWYRRGVWSSETIMPQNIERYFTIAIEITEFALCVGVLLSVSRCIRTKTIHQALNRALVTTPYAITGCYILWTTFFATMNAYFNDDFGLLGRYWVPMVLPLVIILVHYIPKVLVYPREVPRIAVSTVAAATMIVATSLQAAAWNTENRRLNGHLAPLTNNRFIAVTAFEESGKPNCECFDLSLKNGERIHIEGWGLDQRSGRPADEAYILIDGIRKNLRYGRPEPKQRIPRFFDDNMSEIAFSGDIESRGLKRGKHEITVWVAKRGDLPPLPWRKKLSITVQ